MSTLFASDVKAGSSRSVSTLLLVPCKAKTKSRTEGSSKARGPSARQPDKTQVVAGLTGQQRAVARLVAQGLTNPEIAERLHLSPHTVRNYLSRVMARLGVHNRTAVAVVLTEVQSQRSGPLTAAQNDQQSKIRRL